MRLISILTIIIFMAIAGITVADRMPSGMPENQVLSTDMYIDVTGSIDQSNTLRTTVASLGAIPDGPLGSTQTITDISYMDSILTNGGRLRNNKNFDFEIENSSIENIEKFIFFIFI